MAKKTGTALVKWDEEFKNIAKQTTQGIKVAEGKFISFKSGDMTFAGVSIPDNELRCVVMGWCHHNAYYDPDVRYDSKNPQTPLCYASNAIEEDMAPHDDSPEKQCDLCSGCALNEFGSAQSGRGKACKNSIRLALIAEDDLDDIANAEVVYANIPPKSIKNWLSYLTKELRDKAERPHWSVITLLKCIPDAESQFKITFANEELITDNKKFGPLKALWEKTMTGIDFPYAVKEAPAKVTKKKPAKFGRR